jgi:hypothetical protein
MRDKYEKAQVGWLSKDLRIVTLFYKWWNWANRSQFYDNHYKI